MRRLVGGRNLLVRRRSPWTGAILGVPFSSWVRRGESVERIAAWMGGWAVVVGAHLVAGFAGVLGIVLLGPVALAATVPSAFAWAILMRWLIGPTGERPSPIRVGGSG
jgi:hypothetical protein